MLLGVTALLRDKLQRANLKIASCHHTSSLSTPASLSPYLLHMAIISGDVYWLSSSGVTAADGCDEGVTGLDAGVTLTCAGDGGAAAAPS